MALIVQWNCHGFFAHLAEIKKLIEMFNPVCLCLQETYLIPEQNYILKGYKIFRRDNVSGRRRNGGVAVLVKDKYFSREHHINSNSLQAIAIDVKTSSQLFFTICNMYIPPDQEIIKTDVDNILNNFNNSYFLLGDFNSHNTLWGSHSINSRGRVMEAILIYQDLVIMNNKAPTHFSSAQGTYSSIDLTLASPSLARKFKWFPHQDLCSSDHFPLIIAPLEKTKLKLVNNQMLKVKNVNWEVFNSNVKFGDDSSTDVNSRMENFKRAILEAADATLLKGQRKEYPPPVPWWNEDCRRVTRERRKILNRFNKFPTNENLAAFRKAKAKARLVINTSKRKSWHDFLESLNPNTPNTVIWRRLKSVLGQTKSPGIAFLIYNGGIITDKKELANILANHFYTVSSDINYSREFLRLKSNMEGNVIHFNRTSHLLKEYNRPLTLMELEHSLRKCKNTSPGLDSIPNAVIKNLSFVVKSRLLEIFNKIWFEGDFPAEWRHGIVVPVHKSNSLPQEPQNFRPICLLSCLGKTMERMVNYRLKWLLKKNKLISKYQCGYKSQHSCLDQIVRLEKYIKDGFVENKHTVAVFFDIKKAYDTTWRYIILKFLKDNDIDGPIAIYIQNFLKDRTFQVRIGNVMSDVEVQENGVPQGAVISTTLFLIAINGIVKNIDSSIEVSLFVDDLAIYFSSGNLNEIKNNLQIAINKIYDWSKMTGFRISEEKSACVHFCRKRKAHLDPDLYLGNHRLPFTDSYKFLGVTFDKRLTWIEHIKNLKTKCIKSLSVLKIISSIKWGANGRILLNTYRALVRSKLDFGCQVYGAAPVSSLKVLDTIHNSGLRISLGAFRTSPVESLYAEAAESNLVSRRSLLTLGYVLKIRSLKDHPSYSSIFNNNADHRYMAKPRSPKPLSFRCNEILNDLGLVNILDHVENFSNDCTPPWLKPRVLILLNLLKFTKHDTPPVVYKTHFLQLLSRFPSYKVVYTDGAKSANGVGCAFVEDDAEYCFKLSNYTSIFCAELKAIELALRANCRGRLIIVSDSASALQAINCFDSKVPIISRIHTLIYQTKSLGGDVIFVWAPGHIGIEGNEKADRAAKKGLEKSTIDDQRVHFGDLKIIVKEGLKEKWEKRWEEEVVNHLRRIMPKIDLHKTYLQDLSRREQVVLTRLRIGHTRLTHSYLFRRENTPICDRCQTARNVQHILMECLEFNDARREIGLPSKIEDLLDPKSTERKLFQFLKRINLFGEI